MNKKIKFIYYSYLTLIWLLVIIVVVGASLWFISRWVGEKNQKIINSNISLLLEKTGASESDVLRGCLYDKETVVFSIDHKYYFTIKNGQVKLMDIMHAKQPELYPNLERDREFLDIYWLLENCR